MKLSKILLMVVPMLLSGCFGIFDGDIDQTIEFLRVSNQANYGPLRVTFNSESRSGEVRLWNTREGFRQASETCGEFQYNALVCGEGYGSFSAFALSRNGDQTPVGIAEIYRRLDQFVITYERDGIMDTLDVDFEFHTEPAAAPSLDNLAGFVSQEFGHQLIITDELFE